VAFIPVQSITVSIGFGVPEGLCTQRAWCRRCGRPRIRRNSSATAGWVGSGVATPSFLHHPLPRCAEQSLSLHWQVGCVTPLPPLCFAHFSTAFCSNSIFCLLADGRDKAKPIATQPPNPIHKHVGYPQSRPERISIIAPPQTAGGVREPRAQRSNAIPLASRRLERPTPQGEFECAPSHRRATRNWRLRRLTALPTGVGSSCRDSPGISPTG
jgi:hypothetical protein